MNRLRKRIMPLMLVVIAVVLAACGTPSKEDVLKKLSGKWNDSKGYELQATMEIKTELNQGRMMWKYGIRNQIFIV